MIHDNEFRNISMMVLGKFPFFLFCFLLFRSKEKKTNYNYDYLKF